MQHGILLGPKPAMKMPGTPKLVIAAGAVIASAPVLVLLVLLSTAWPPLHTVDMSVVRSLNGLVTAHPGQLWLWKTVSTLFGPVLLPIVVLVLTGVLWFRGQRRSAILVAVATIGAALLSSIIKVLISRPRPAPLHPVEHAAGYSFPSGHTLTSMVVIGVVLVVLLPRVSSVWKMPIAAAAFVLAAAVGLSRLMLGVHYLTDVVGSWLIGGVWLLVLIAGFRHIPYRRVVHKL